MRIVVAFQHTDCGRVKSFWDVVLFRTGWNSLWKDSINLMGENQVFDALVASCLLQLGVVGKSNLPTTRLER